ncbi:hypothetical protein MAC_02490 [Metarhizium acridum CQMa 102]|uniref:Major facilitator superfamily (MFS) profile domain-containing protein n=1 Tax=Metarhizium acridum (strain CQMa 102) TaxID=655827 RepID=E9DXZ2_METAQ|nr:uncharacterized protein MAC_02490 [Metarhizium acridum CQMa 102]EFY91605.1 hypothetical protein MAC_02490 [Metarhizium acridum CQMa 102]
MSATTTISAIELEQMPMPVEPAPVKLDIKQPRVRPDAASGPSCILDENGGSEPCPHSAVAATERWNGSRTNVYRIAACFFSFLVMGANDSAYGPLIPYLEKYYKLTYIVVSLVFLSPFVGYVCSAILNNYLHHKVGQRGIAVICSACHAAAYTIIALHPPYIVLVFAFILAGFGNGVADAAWNAWVGNLASSSELLGLLHACYGVGGAVSPTIATTLIAKANLGWYSFYYIMIGMAGVEMAVLASAFWSSSGAEYRRIHKNESNRMGLSEALFRTPSARVTWLTAAFLLCYVGVEVALGGWIVIFMLRVRHGEAFASGMSAVGFWLGITAGRAVLGFVTPRVGVKLSTALYIVAAGLLELIFWLVPQFYVSVVAVAFQGFFLGPMFPNAVLVAQKLLPRQHHVVVIGFAAAFGGCGAAVLPFLTGILAQAKGPMVLQPIVLALLAVMLGIWLCFPRAETKRE